MRTIYRFGGGVMTINQRVIDLSKRNERNNRFKQWRRWEDTRTDLKKRDPGNE